MNKQCLNINDEVIMDRLEYFIYDYSDLEYNNIEIIVNNSIGNTEDREKVRNKDSIWKLREILLHDSFREQLLKEDDVEESIDLFLLFLRTHSIEASLCLNTLLDVVWKAGKIGSEWESVKRLNGILAAIYLLYFCSKSKLFSEKVTAENMKCVYRRNINFYTKEDKNFLIHMFMMKKQFDCMVDLLGSFLVIQGKDEKCTIDSEEILWKEFWRILQRMRIGELYDDALVLFKESERIFNIVSIEVNERWEQEKSEFLFRLGKYEEAKVILDKYVDRFEEANNVYVLYNNAVNCAWAANYKEKDDQDWKMYMEKARKLIALAEETILKKDKLNNKPYRDILCEIALEKSFLLSENGNYDEAYKCFLNAFFNADKEIQKSSNFNTHLWIMMKYMCLNPNENVRILECFNYFYNNFNHIKLREYLSIVEFMNTNEYLKTTPELYSDIYINLLKLHFHALEILHETKIRDISKYDVLYYTKAEYLRLLLEDEDVNNISYRLPIFHACHMNDPQEGEILQTLLGCKEISYANGTDVLETRNIYKENYVFLKSFFCYRKKDKKAYVKEFLPMWVQYGDDAKGCCVVLNNKTFEKTALRRIIYLSEDGKCEDENVQKFLKGFQDAYNCLINLCKRIEVDSEQGRECLQTIESLMQYSISRIQYLFKHDSYKHEKEVRLIINRTNIDIEDVKVISGNVPKVYIYNDKQTYIDEVILGAKMKNPEDYIPFIYKQGNKMWKDNAKSKIRVTHSLIQYR